MKYFVAIALIATVASAAIIKPTQVSGELAEIQEIVAAINSPSTNPATAAALEEMLWDVLGIKPEPVAVGPAIVDTPIAPSPVIVAPAPVAESEEIGSENVIASPVTVEHEPIFVTDVEEVGASPSPAVIESIPTNTPLVEIIVNINQATASDASPVAPSPVTVPEAAMPEVVHVVEHEPVIVVEAAPVNPEPVQVVETAPVQPEPVVSLPEELN